MLHAPATNDQPVTSMRYGFFYVKNSLNAAEPFHTSEDTILPKLTWARLTK